MKTSKLPERFVIDWSELKQISLDTIAGQSGKHFARSENRSVATRALQGGRWEGFTGGQLERWLHSGYQIGNALDLGNLLPVREKRKYVFSEDDGEFNLDLVLSGEDRYLSDWTKKISMPGVGIEAEIAMAASTDSSVLSAYFQWLNQMIYSLEVAGIDTQIDLIYNCASGLFRGHDSRRFVTQIRVKQEGEISDFSSWSAMVSPASLRGLMFAAICKHAERNSVTVQSGLGRRDRSEWSVKYDPKRQRIIVNPAWPGAPFPEAQMSRQFQTALAEMRGPSSS